LLRKYSERGSNGKDEVKDKNFKLMEEKMKNKNCKFYGSCSAPLCPMLSDEQNTNCIWYPDEDICRKRKGLPDWVKQQRKIAKKAKPENFWHYFTLDMLKVRFRVTKMKLTEEQLKKKRLAMAKAREAKEQKHKPINKKAA
jgi:hypothetical protein